MSQLYDTLKKKVQDEQTRGAVVARAEHTLQSIGAIPQPGSFARHTSRANNVHEMSAVKRTPHQTKFSMDQRGVEQLHPHQRSGSAPRAQTSSEVAAAAHVNAMMAPPVRPGGREPLSRVSTIPTPAQRISRNHNRAAANNTFPPQSVRRPSGSHQYATHSTDRHALGQDRSVYQHAGYSGHVMSPNIHARMSANRGLY